MPEAVVEAPRWEKPPYASLRATLEIQCPVCKEWGEVEFEGEDLAGGVQISQECECGGRVSAYLDAEVRHRNPGGPVDDD